MDWRNTTKQVGVRLVENEVEGDSDSLSKVKENSYWKDPYLRRLPVEGPPEEWILPLELEGVFKEFVDKKPQQVTEEDLSSFLFSRDLGDLDISSIRIRFWLTFFSFYLQRWLFFLFKFFENFSYKKKSFIAKQTFDASFIFFLAMLKITPILILKPIYIGSVCYDMPFPLNYWKRISFGCRWV